LAQDQIISLDIQEDFAEKLAASRPVQALAELVWNGFDAEATLSRSQQKRVSSAFGP